MAAQESLEGQGAGGRVPGPASPWTRGREAPAEARVAAARIAATLERLGGARTAESDAAYPAGLRELPDPPRVLFVRASCRPPARVAIVGSPAASTYGMACARRIARDLATLGYWVVSGLARGIDARRTRGTPRPALEPGGVRAASMTSPRGIIGCSPDPVRARGLATEWPAGGPVARGVFVQRNRLIAARPRRRWIEAAERSGALSTRRRLGGSGVRCWRSGRHRPSTARGRCTR